MIRVQEEPFDPYAELERFTKKRPNVGAVASFVGLVRDEGDKVDALILDHYPGFTEKEIKRIETEARGRFDVADTLVIHRHGRMIPGEAIVLVAAAAAHRKPALEAVDFLMDYLKTGAPFWKREEGSGGERWIEPHGDDHLAREEWAARVKRDEVK
jgi:molybdopterin synthase catalytic subunit